MGVTLFWGPYYLPIPYFPKVTLCIADPIKVNKWDSDDPIPVELIEELHNKYINSLKDLFNKYKVLAGHPDAVLEII